MTWTGMAKVSWYGMTRVCMILFIRKTISLEHSTGNNEPYFNVFTGFTQQSGYRGTTTNTGSVNINEVSTYMTTEKFTLSLEMSDEEEQEQQAEAEKSSDTEEELSVLEIVRKEENCETNS